MTTKNTGGPAFPFTDTASPLEHPGMTLRDYLAAKAMQGFVSNPDIEEEVTLERLAKTAYGLADAMLAARENS